MTKMDHVMDIAKTYDLKVVEDACQSILASYLGKKAGTWGNVGAFSLHPLKNINVWSDGGVIVTNNQELYENLKLLRNHGLSDRDHVELLGFNSRLDTFQAVVGNWLLPQAVEISEKRIANAKYLDSRLKVISGLRFRDRILTFNTVPKWHNLSSCKTLCEKVESLKNSPWGGSTDFMKAIENILEVAVLNKLSNDEIPDLIVFSDMQFNEADSKFLTHYEIIKKKFNNAGYTTIPKIIFWNLRGNTNGFPVDSKCENVQLLSGFSPSLFKLILTGEQGVTCTPEQVFKNAVNDEAYNKIREIVEKYIV